MKAYNNTVYCFTFRKKYYILKTTYNKYSFVKQYFYVVFIVALYKVKILKASVLKRIISRSLRLLNILSVIKNAIII